LNLYFSEAIITFSPILSIIAEGQKMLRKILVVVGFLVLGHLLLTQSVEAHDDYERSPSWSQDAKYRDAIDAEDWIEQGRALVTDSPIFRDGIRLTAWAVEEGEEFEPGLASTVYRFTVPDWVHYVKIRVSYKDASKDDEVAGRLWIKAVDNEAEREIAPEEEAPFYGDTFILRSDRSSETIYIPSRRHVEDKRLELHIVAEGKDCLDVKFIRVEYLEEKPARIKVVRHFCDDYWYRWPLHRYVYHYYYFGPCYWPRAYLVYEWCDWPCNFYWTVWRPWFRIYVRAHYHHPWWGPRRYTVVYHSDPYSPSARKRALFRNRLKERHVLVKKVVRSQPLVRVKARAPSHTRTFRSQKVKVYKQIRNNKELIPKRSLDTIRQKRTDQQARVEKRQERRGIKPHTVGKNDYKSRTKLENRANSRILTLQTREARLKSQKKGQPELRGKSLSRRHGTMKTSPIRLRNLPFGRARR
jgi:hypothetical protein